VRGVALPACILSALAFSACAGAARAPATVSACRGPALAATFSVVPGSAGAGNIVYLLRVRNHSGASCFVSGPPRLVLLGRHGRPLPTRPHPWNPGALTAVRVVLRPGGWASASARFSPDVPGPGEPVSGRNCELPAAHVRVTPLPGGGTTLAPVLPPTPVCEHGGMELSVFAAGRNGALPR
jgi:hypothetical protein